MPNMPASFDKALYQPPPGAPEMEEASEVEVILEDDEPEIVDEPEVAEPMFGDNIADSIDEQELARIANELIDAFEVDKNSRSEWEKIYTDGIELLGMKIEQRSKPWKGASGVFHPLLLESVIQFQSQAMMETFPPSGPAKTVIVGHEDNERLKQAERVANEINYQCTEVMTEYRSETERMLFSLPMMGSAFKKVYYDPNLGRQTAMFVPADEFYVAYGTSDLETCTRATHVLKTRMNDVRKLQEAGFYSDIELSVPMPELSRTEEAENKKDGVAADYRYDDRLTLLEVMADLNIEGIDGDGDIALPYVVTIDKQTSQVLSIYRNWEEGDPKFTRKQHFVHYNYFPGDGFYGIGLVHVLGGLAKSATSILRQLIDAGTLANTPGGFKAKSFRAKNDDTPIAPGEWRDIDLLTGTMRDSLLPLPAKEPSPVLRELLNDLIAEGRRLGSIANLQVGDFSQQAPVGTTLALLERSMKIMSAVQARVHASLRKELKLLSAIIARIGGPYDYKIEGEYTRDQDFDDRVDVIPVSDPNAATMSQRVVQYQAVFQLAESAPDIYDRAELHRSMLRVLQIPNADKLVPRKDQVPRADPVTENMNILMGSPVKAYLEQDHDAHLSVHMAALNDPMIREMVGQSPNASSIQGAMLSHITEHVAMQYRGDIEEEMGVDLPPPGQPMPPEVEAKYSKVVAEAAQKLLAKHVKQAEELENQRKEEDPVLEIQRREVAVKEGELKRKQEEDEHERQIDWARIAVEQERIRAQTKVKGAEIGADIMASQDKNRTAREVAKERKNAASSGKTS